MTTLNPHSAPVKKPEPFSGQLAKAGLVFAGRQRYDMGQLWQQGGKDQVHFSGQPEGPQTVTGVQASAAPALKFGSDGPQEMRLADYKPPVHLLGKTDLTFELNSESDVVVSSRLQVRPNPESTEPKNVMELDGAPEKAPEGSETPTMALLEVKIDGRVLDPSEYSRQGEKLILNNVPEKEFTLEIKTGINPAANKALEGLYTSGGKFITQCESHGFQNMTFYPDRPDVLSEFTTTIMADTRKLFGKKPPGWLKKILGERFSTWLFKLLSPGAKGAPLLSNGNPGERVTLPDGREKITWHNPHLKPSYLFALVAGDFGMIEDTFTTQSGRKVDLQIFVDRGDEEKARHAMEALKKFLKWDEENYGREYDLDRYQIVVTNDFNMGAMENKGLNIFNATAALADPKTATDARYGIVQDVIAHEATHNWRGNRVTVKNWFQVCLKEGLTTFTEQEFSADMTAPTPAVKRIEDVIAMRSVQFPEDASAMAHPIRPAAVGSMENFYTPTVYEKGAEVIRMIKTMIGTENFRKGMDLYFDRHDGQAVTTEDFVQAMEDASGVDLTQFERTWYNQAGTPTLDVTDSYDPETQEYRLTIKQSTPPTPGQPTKEPFHIPVRIGLLDAQGQDMPLKLAASQKDLLTNGDILNLKNGETTFVFKGVKEKPTPSLLRNWSAPVKLNYDYSREQLAFLMSRDSDGFNRWEAGQLMAVDVLKDLVAAHQAGQPATVDPLLIESFRSVLQDSSINPALAAMALELPTASYLAELYPDGQVDVDAIHAALNQTRQAIGQALEPLLLETFNASRSTESRAYEWNKEDVAERAIKNTALSYLVEGNPQTYLPLAIEQYDRNQNMTDLRTSLRLILDHADPATCKAKLDRFYDEHKDNPLAMNQWFADQALADRPDVLENVQALTQHPSYDGKNPNAVRGLVRAFTANTPHFHKADGSGYQFVADQIIAIDKFNPSLAAGLTKTLSTPHRFDRARQDLIKAQLERIQGQTQSAPVREIVGKTLSMLAAKQAES